MEMVKLEMSSSTIERIARIIEKHNLDCEISRDNSTVYLVCNDNVLNRIWYYLKKELIPYHEE